MFAEHESSRCDFVRCHQDVYNMGDGWPVGIQIFAIMYVWIFLVFCIVGMLLSIGHLRYFEGLYMERYKAMPFLKAMWRNAVSSYMVGAGKVRLWFAPERLRLFHGLLILNQGVLTAAMTVGKLSILDNWFIEFDISVLVLGYECGRHAPSMGYIKKSTRSSDIYLMTTRLNWHRESMYHYFIICAFQAYLTVSGGYRILPGDDLQNDDVLRETLVAAFGAQDSASALWMNCPSGMSSEARLSGAIVIYSLFFFLFFSSAWLSIAHYLQYQELKRDHSILLSFAAGFRSMLERRRKRITYAFNDFDDDGEALCPPGGFPVEYATNNGRLQVCCLLRQVCVSMIPNKIVWSRSAARQTVDRSWRHHVYESGWY